VGSEKWEVGSEKWEVGSEKWELGNGKWEVGNPYPEGVKYNSPGSAQRHPGKNWDVRSEK